MASIKSIVIQPQELKYTDPMGAFNRVAAPSVTLITDFGIEGDQKAGGNPTRQVNLLTADWLNQMTAAGYKTKPGQFGEQIVVDGITFAEMQPGLQIQLGDEAVIEITKARTGCDRLESAQGQPIPANLKTAIGHMGHVVHGGRIKLGDSVSVLETKLA